MKKTSKANEFFEDTLMVSCAIICRREGMAEYFKTRSENFGLITVASKLSKGTKPKCELYKSGKLMKTFDLISFPEWLLNLNKYVIHINYMVSIIWAVIKLRKKFHIYIGEGHIYSLTGIILRGLGFCKKIIYSSGDYFTDVKSFLIIDNFLSKHIEGIWSATNRMQNERDKHVTEFKPNCARVVMPLGIIPNNLVEKKFEDINRNILFIGNIQKQQGLDLFLDIFPNIVKLFPDVHLHVIGDGIHAPMMREKAKNLNLLANITFYGFINDENQLKGIFRKCSLGLALYDPNLAGFTRLSDPGKVKDYISHGVPVIMTHSFEFSETLANMHGGIIVNYNAKEVEKGLLNLLANKKTLHDYSNATLLISKEFTWDKILDRTISDTLSRWYK